jgi:hypothetical protein
MAGRPSLNEREARKSGLRPLLVMMEALDDGSLAELERAVRLTRNSPPSPAERRLAELGILALLLNEIAPRQALGFALLARKQYDELRPATGTSSAALVRRYGSWNAACYAAFGLQPEGRWLGPGRPWPSQHGSPSVKPYSREEVLAALRQCQRELGRRPSVPVFTRWTREKRRDARQRGAAARLPGPSTVYRYYPSLRGGWTAALRAAGR